MCGTDMKEAVMPKITKLGRVVVPVSD